MNKLKPTTFADRVRNAVKAFKGQPIGSLTFGVEVKKCAECEYRSSNNWPDFHDFEVGTDRHGTYFLSLFNDTGSALGVFTREQVETLISTLRDIMEE